MFFHPGVQGEVNGGYDDSDGKLRAFLTLDSGATDQELMTLAAGNSVLLTDLRSWVTMKIDLQLPAFVYFAMPSRPTAFHLDDGIPWGYNNSILQTAETIDTNSNAMNSYFHSRFKPEMQLLSPNDYQKVPLNILAHSMGGIITRNWLSRGESYPQIDHYITFDSPHGGVRSLLALAAPFWTEQYFNGTNAQLNTPPAVSDRGWGYARRLLSHGGKNLMFSAPDDDLISPEGIGSALGVGRIMHPALGGLLPNGYCERLVSGWQLDVPGEDHSIQLTSQALVSAARYMAFPSTPRIGTRSNPIGLNATATLGGPSGPCPITDFVGPISGEVMHELIATAGTSAEEPLFFDTAEMIVVEGLVTQSDADLIVVDSMGAALPRQNEIRVPIDGEIYSVSYGVSVTQGTGALRLIAGTQDTLAYGRVRYGNGLFATTLTTANHYAQGSPVTVNAEILDAASMTIQSPGVALATVTKPDGTESSVSLFDDGMHGDGTAGDGLFGGIFTETSQAGRYGLKSDLLVDTGSGGLTRRIGKDIFFVNSNGAALVAVTNERTVDDDGDMLWAAVEVDIDLTTTTNGTYRISAEIEIDGAFARELVQQIVVTSAPSTETVTLRIPGYLLHHLGYNTSLRLRSIELTESVQSLYLGSLPDYSAQSYQLSSFDLPEPPALSYVRPSYGADAGGYPLFLSALVEGIGPVHPRVFFGTQELSSRFASGVVEVTAPAWSEEDSVIPIRVVMPWGESAERILFEYQSKAINSTDTTISTGQRRVGSLERTYRSDDDSLEIEGNLQSEVTFSFVVPDPDPTYLDLIVEVGVNEDASGTISIMNWNTSQWDTLATPALSLTDQEYRFNSLLPSDYIRPSDGRLQIRMNSQRTTSSTGLSIPGNLAAITPWRFPTLVTRYDHLQLIMTP